MTRQNAITTKRIYEPVSDQDGFRIFVERLWPRGVSKNKAAIDLWLKEIAPSNKLRKWFNHEPNKWAEFKKQYYSEIKEKKYLIGIIRDKLVSGNVTLLYGSREEEYNAANALLSHIKQMK